MMLGDIFILNKQRYFYLMDYILDDILDDIIPKLNILIKYNEDPEETNIVYSTLKRNSNTKYF